ncbi:mitochondrial 54S ribosomal protein YmL33 [Scheffersomyces xylosifermentans]|uniref:mitochondrial 54S ribosomal protein YmL33 n=1 Tax=Scheffersomyces xylosifermentans TaxID=1304137 RepID=UPI00315DE3C2
MSAAKQLFYKITQIRSTIGMPPIIRKNIQALGLKKRNQIVYQSVSPSTAHKLARVKELVKVELVEEKKTVEQLSAERKFNPGFKLIKGDLTKKSYE